MNLLLSKFTYHAIPHFGSHKREKTCALIKAAKKNASKIESLQLQVGFLTNDGAGYTTPEAIRNVEKVTKTKINKMQYLSLNSLELKHEIENGFKYIENNGLENKYISRADAFIELLLTGEIAAPKALEILEKIQEKVKSLDCIFIPGGIDVPSIWFRALGNRCSLDDYSRSFTELCLIKEARKRGVPLMGVCRGLQIVHVYYGSKIVQEVLDQYGTQTLTLANSEDRGLLADIFRQGIYGEVMHNQGISVADGSRPDCELSTLCIYDGVIKAAESKYGGAAPLILTQFHPEMYENQKFKFFDNAHINKFYNNICEMALSLLLGRKSFDIRTENNEKLFKIFNDSTVAKNRKQHVITPHALQVAKSKLQKV